jgi:hypothetical protein
LGAITKLQVFFCVSAVKPIREIPIMLKKQTTALFVFVLVVPLAGEAGSIQELQKQCDDAREHCERFYADFGQGGTTQSGGFRQRMFHDIPECQPLYEAERNR